MHLDVGPVDKVDAVLEAIPHAAAQRHIRPPVSDRVGVAAPVHADHELPAGAAAGFPHEGEVGVFPRVHRHHVITGSGRVVVPHVEADVEIRGGRNDVVLLHVRGIPGRPALHHLQRIAPARRIDTPPGNDGEQLARLAVVELPIVLPPVAVPHGVAGRPGVGAPVALKDYTLFVPLRRGETS